MTDAERQALKKKLEAKRNSTAGEPFIKNSQPKFGEVTQPHSMYENYDKERYKDSYPGLDTRYERSFLEKLLPVMIVMVVVVALAAGFVFWKFYLAPGLGVNEKQSKRSTSVMTEAETVPESSVEVSETEEDVTEKWSGTYGSKVIDKYVKDLYSEETDTGDRIYYGTASVVPNDDGTYTPLTVYETDSEEIFAPFECILVRSDDDVINMVIDVCWHGEDRLNMNAVEIEASNGMSYRFGFDHGSVDADEANGFVYETYRFTPNSSFADVMDAVIESEDGTYMLIGEDGLASEPISFTKDQLESMKELVDIMNNIEKDNEN